MSEKEKERFTHNGVVFRLLKNRNGTVAGVRIHGQNTIFFRDTTEDLAKKEAVRLIDEEIVK